MLVASYSGIRVLVASYSGTEVSSRCPGELRGDPERHASCKLFWDLRCPVDVPVSSGEIRSVMLVEIYSGI